MISPFRKSTPALAGDLRALKIAVCVAGAPLLASCRWIAATPVTVPTGQFGSGSGTYVAQCSGDFPDWISSNPPPATGDVNPQESGVQSSFRLAQAYPLGVPILTTGPNGLDQVNWEPPMANEDAPWRAFSNLSDATQRSNYLAALKSYLLEGMSDPGIDFDAQKNDNRLGPRRWFQVPMMTASVAKRREPYHGVTSERGLRAVEQSQWLTPGSDLKAVAVGYYNSLGGYTIGQVFKSYDLSKTDPTKAVFIDGTFVFKLLFAQYDPSRIKSPDPLTHSPTWYVQDPSNPTGPLVQVRLLQVDVAVKDNHFSSTTGWVFATYAYDESLVATEPNPWHRLTAIGIQWGNDPTVTGVAPAALTQTWINPSMPLAFQGHLGRAGRLIGPIDNPVSSCISCHSTAEVDMSQVGNATTIVGAALVPPSTCSTPMDWFRNLPSGSGGAQAFGRGISTCPVNTATTGLTSLDYSLQLQVGVQAVYGFKNSNPCSGFAKAYHDSADDPEATRVMRLAKVAPGRGAQETTLNRQVLRIQAADSKRFAVEESLVPSGSAALSAAPHER